MPEEKIIKVEDLTISYKKWQGKSDKIILCLHGWLDNAASFDLLAPFLSQYTLIAIDLPGHGKSDHLPPSSYYHFIDGVSQIVALAKALELTNYILLGHSLGACLASIAAGAAPDTMSHLILLDAIGPLTSSAADSARHHQSYLKKLPLLMKKSKRYYANIEDAVHIRAQKGYLSSELTRIIARRALEKSDEGYCWRHDDRLLLPSPLRMTEDQVLPFLSEIIAPSLLIRANKGFQFDEEMALKRVQVVPDIKQITLEGGHHIHMEQPEACANAITQFLDN